MGDGREQSAVFVYLDDEGVSTWDGTRPAGIIHPCALRCGKWPRSLRLLASGGISLAVLACLLALMALTEAQRANVEARQANELARRIWYKQQK